MKDSKDVTEQSLQEIFDEGKQQARRQTGSISGEEMSPKHFKTALGLNRNVGMCAYFHNTCDCDNFKFSIIEPTFHVCRVQEVVRDDI